MISVNQAHELIEQAVKSLLPKTVSLNDAHGLTLAEDLFAQTDIPGFDQSSVDGYAFSYVDRVNDLAIIGESAAGNAKQPEITNGQAFRIFTGAPVPLGADTVVMQEFCTVNNGSLVIADANLIQGEHVRPKGAEIRRGALAMQQGERMTTAAIGFLAGIGINQVLVYPAPSVAIIVTGNELQTPGESLTFGQVYEANSVMLRTALTAAGISKVNLLFAIDTLEAVIKQLAIALQQSDVVLLSGGISVGDYDFVLQAANDCGVHQHFHKIKQKPGKPLYFGTLHNKIVFGLPGNPSSSLTCFYEYVLPAIDAMLQRPKNIIKTEAILMQGYHKKAGMTHFAKGLFANGKVELLKAQESYRLASYARANCMIVFAEEQTEFHAGDSIAVHLIPS
jgi:molybdopterin molybdotransferase